MKSKLSPWYVMIYQTLAPQTTSNGPIAARCTISIVSILVTFSLTTRRMSQCLLHHKLFKSSNDFKIPQQVWIPCTHNLSMPPHLTPPTWIPCTHSLTISTHLKHLSPPPTPPPPIIYWVSTTHSGVENLPTPEIGQGNLELTALPHSLDNTKNKMLFYPHNTSTLLWVKPRAK